MEKSFHRFTELFKQLGLASDPREIEAFILQHAPLHESILLYDASFWSPSQARFLREEVLLDADWAEIVDQLNKDLRQ